jgi:DNA (cytosine-5)-methyltransferase 1
MGYKLAGFDVIAACDIDSKMAQIYKENHNPKQFFLMPVKDLLKSNDLPEVDILDGSPPCSVFSVAGQREEAWQKDKVFREGQAKQVLDDLFFDFLKLVEKMKPKVVVAENVKGMLFGNAKWYTREVARQFKALGYEVNVFLLNSATMGVPQRRERVFFIANRLGKKISLNFHEKPIPFKEVSDDTDKQTDLTKMYIEYWKQAKAGRPVGKFKSNKKVSPSKPCNTIVSGNRHYHYKYMRKLNNTEIMRVSSWPTDYDFLSTDPAYVCGMSVPPVMMAQVASEVYKQLLS